MTKISFCHLYTSSLSTHRRYLPHPLPRSHSHSSPLQAPFLQAPS